MNTVISYKDFLHFMRYSNNVDQMVPIVLIRPYTISHLNQDQRLEHFLNYYHNRTRERIHFFLPGYSHYPSLDFQDILPAYPVNAEDFIPLRIDHTKRIYYSYTAFVSFIELLETENKNFRYYGNTELLFVRYIAGHENELGRFDFTHMKRYNLSELYYRNAKNLWYIDHFIETLLHDIFETDDLEEIEQRIEEVFQRWDV